MRAGVLDHIARSLTPCRCRERYDRECVRSMLADVMAADVVAARPDELGARRWLVGALRQEAQLAALHRRAGVSHRGRRHEADA